MAPFTVFKGNLKFTRTELANETSKDAFEFLAPGFFVTEYVEDKKATKLRDRLLNVASKMGFQTTKFDQEPKKRRFAGDLTLSRGSYYSICLEDSDWDNCSLVNEINAYRLPERSDFTMIGDLNDQFVADKYNDGVLEHQFLIFIRNTDLFVKIFPRHKGVETTKNSIVVKYPYIVEYFEIENVIDLRLPDTREWFFHTFRTGDGVFLQKPKGNNIHSFYHMLPALMHIDLGGFNETQGIGTWMRHNAVNALIYPSARSDSTCVIQNGQLEYHSGWNLVDYRNTKEKPISDTMYDLSPWFEELFVGVNLEVAPPDSPYFGSFKVSGNEEFHLSLWEKRLSKFVR